MAANMAEGELSGLPRPENQNNAKLIEGLNTLGAAFWASSGDAGRVLTGSIEGTRQACAAMNRPCGMPPRTRRATACRSTRTA